MRHGQALEQWALADLGRTRDEARRERLKKLLADIHRHPESTTLPVGSPQRLLVESKERQLMETAMLLGYEPPEQALRDLGIHLGLELGLGL
jgi:hypothetical protein